MEADVMGNCKILLIFKHRSSSSLVVLHIMNERINFCGLKSCVIRWSTKLNYVQRKYYLKFQSRYLKTRNMQIFTNNRCFLNKRLIITFKDFRGCSNVKRRSRFNLLILLLVWCTSDHEKSFFFLLRNHHKSLC